MSDPSYPIYAMGDVHGHLAQLEAALIAIEKDGGKDAAVVFIGDLVDHGQLALRRRAQFRHPKGQS